MKCKVTGTMTISYEAEVEADSETEAREIVEDICFLDISEAGIVVTDIGVNTNEIDDIENLSETEWDDNMSKLDRIRFLKGIGCSDDCAYELAGREGYELPEEYLNQLEIE